MNDDEELELEEGEREQRVKLDLQFEGFINLTHTLVTSFRHHQSLTYIFLQSRNNMEFDIPYKELGFHGVPYKSNVMLFPTVNCLVSLTETPVFISEIADIEWAHFERVSVTYFPFQMLTANVFK